MKNIQAGWPSSILELVEYSVMWIVDVATSAELSLFAFYNQHKQCGRQPELAN